jgi:hypothetical protein
MSFNGRLGAILVVLGIFFLFLPFTRELAFISMIMVAIGAVSILRSIGGSDRIKGLLRSMRARSIPSSRQPALRIDPLLPVRVLKLAEGREGSLTVSMVAIALNVGLDECQVALDELVRKGAANVDIDLSTGVATYRFPEFQPRADEGGEPR